MGLGLGVGLGLRPYLDPTRKRFLARKREQHTAPKIRAANLLSELEQSGGLGTIQVLPLLRSPVTSVTSVSGEICHHYHRRRFTCY